MVSQALWWNDHTTYNLMGHTEATNGEPGLVVEMTTPLTDWWGTKRPQMVSQALWLKGPHHLHADVERRGHKWWARPCGWNNHTTYWLMGHKEATNGEPGLVVEMTTPLTDWCGTKRPQMVSQALWLKRPHHLHADGAQKGHKWWVSPYEPNKYFNIPGDCHLWTGDWWSVQVDLTI